MNWSWTLPWNGSESLLGLLVGDNIELHLEEGQYDASLISIGFIIFRIDIIFNVTIKE